ncbi:MAG: 5'-nucleotidase C-terminal domain-containing protein [Holophaga sp.]|nr:5'-nucleotidase C-terminal domain-containing protein [Holophaga sp.]
MKVFLTVLFSLGLGLTAQTHPKLERAQPIPVTDAIAEDPAVAKVIAPLSLELKASFGKELVQCPTGLMRGKFGEENLLGYWVADLMRERAQQVVGAPVRFAITNAGGLRGNIRPGVVKIADIYEVMPFDNELVVAEYTGAEIIQIVKDAIRRRAGEPCSGVSAKVLGTPEKPEFSITWSDGTAIVPTETFKVALSDYLLSSGDNISALRSGRRPITTGVPLRDLLLDACTKLGESKTPLQAPSAQRYEFAPGIYQALRDKKIVW